jgi:S-formylglutathione hydrolase FrmB
VARATHTPIFLQIGGDPVRKCLLLGALGLSLLGLPCEARAALGSAHKLDQLNRGLAGQVVDHTHNHGQDRRIWSEALQARRDLYVYLPPCFDPQRRYPVVIWLHGLGQDEQEFVFKGVPLLDAAIAGGRLPPVILAIPDGQVSGRPGLITSQHSGFINSDAGCFGDYLTQDVYSFMVQNYPIRPERAAHVLAGVSIGGGGAYHNAIKHRDCFGVVCALFPPLNIRWVDCHGRYFGHFDPCCWGWRNDVSRSWKAVGRFYGVIKVPLRRLVDPLYGRGPDAVARMSADNPIEMLEAYDVQPGQLAMYVAYGGKDEFNLDAQIESFLYRARERHLDVGVAFDPHGHHNLQTAIRLSGGLIDWLAVQLAPFAS